MDPQLLKLLKKRQAAAASEEEPSSPRASNSVTNNLNPYNTPQSTPLTNKWKTLELTNNDITKPSITATPVKTPQSTYTRGVAQAPTSAYGTNTVYSATTPKVGNVGNGNVQQPTTPTSNSNKLVYDKNNSNWEDSDDDNVVLLGTFVFGILHLYE